MKIPWHMLEGDLNKYPSKRVPLPWAVVGVTCAALALAFFLGNWNFTLWPSFIIWAAYFALGAKRSNWRVIFPSIPFGALSGALLVGGAVILKPYFTHLFGIVGLWGAYCVSACLGVWLLVYSMRFSRALSVASLAKFNAFTMYLGIYFTMAVPHVGPMENPYWIVWWVWIWNTLMCWFGWFLGWLTVVWTFQRKVTNLKSD